MEKERLELRHKQNKRKRIAIVKLGKNNTAILYTFTRQKVLLKSVAYACLLTKHADLNCKKINGQFYKGLAVTGLATAMEYLHLVPLPQLSRFTHSPWWLNMCFSDLDREPGWDSRDLPSFCHL